MDEQHANHQASQVNYRTWGRAKRERLRGANQGEWRGGRGRSGEGAGKDPDGAEGSATGAEAGIDSIHCQTSAGTQALRPQQTPKVEASHYQGQGENREARLHLDDLCTDVYEELDRTKEYVLSQKAGGAPAHEAKPGALDHPAKGIGVQGKCRGTHGRGGSDGDRRAPGSDTPGTMGCGLARRRGGRRRWAQQGVQRTPTLRETKQEGQDRQNQETSSLNGALRGLGWGRTIAWMSLSYGLGWIPLPYVEKSLRSYYHENKDDYLLANIQDFHTMWLGFNIVKDVVVFDYHVDNDTVKFDYSTSYDMKECGNRRTEGAPGVAFQEGDQGEQEKPDFDIECDLFRNAMMLDTCPLYPLVKEEEREPSRDNFDIETAPNFSRQQIYHYHFGVESFESTWETFNCTGSEKKSHEHGKTNLWESVLWMDSQYLVILIAGLGIFLFGILPALAWTPALISDFGMHLTGLCGDERFVGGLSGISVVAGLTTPFWMGHLIGLNLRAEYDAYWMALRILGNLCADTIHWSGNNKCAIMMILIATTLLLLLGHEMMRLCCRRCRIERRGILVCRQRRTTRRRIQNVDTSFTRLLIYYFLMWNHVEVMADNTLSQRVAGQPDNWTMYEGPSSAKGNTTWLPDQLSAGSLPHRVREQSSDLYQRMQNTADQERDQWDLEREVVNRDAQITGKIEIQDEFDALERHTRDGVQLFLYGIQQQQIGMESIRMHSEDLGDFLDLLVLVRRVWQHRIQVLLFHVAYINPQVPPVVLDGVDGLSLICDFAPALPGTPIAILSSTTFPGDETTYDLSIHRAPNWIGAEDVMRMTGFTLLCASNARCTCSFAGRPIGPIPVRAFAGMRIDITVTFHRGWCQDNNTEGNQPAPDRVRVRNDIEQDDHMLMQTTLRGGTPAQWLYAYPLYGSDVIRAWEGGRGEREHARYLAELYRLQKPQYFAREMKCFDVRPQPDDLTEMLTRGFVVAVDEEMKAWQVLVLVDLIWLTSSQESTGAMPPQENLWRAAKAIDYQLDLKSLYEQLGISIFCEDRAACTTWIRGFEWTEESRLVRAIDGDYVKIRISSAREDTPLGTQWDLAQQGCTLAEMPLRLATRSSDATSTATTTSTPFTNTTYDTHRLDEVDRGDAGSFMQHQMPELWTFVYLEREVEPLAEHLTGYEVTDPIYALKRRMMRRVPHMRGEQLLFFKAKPQPPDLAEMRTTGYLHTIPEQMPPRKSFIMLDVEFFGNTRPQWRSTPTPSNEWREIRFVDQHTTRFLLLDEVGLRTFCYEEGSVCFLHVKGILWPTQDVSVREVADGDYVIVKIKAKEDRPISEQWKEANGVCDEPPRGTYQQALLDFDAQRLGEVGEEEHSIDGNVSLIQTDIQIVGRTTPATHARERLPPPGNGPKRRVTFNDLVVHVSTGSRPEIWKDHLISNDFVLRTCQRREEKGNNCFFDNYLDNLRFEKMEDERKPLPLKKLPVEEETIDTPDELHDEQPSCFHFLPIQQPAKEEPEPHNDMAIIRKEETDGVYRLHKWIDDVKIMPYYDLEQVPWKPASRKWASLDTWIFQEAEEMCFCVDGAKKGTEIAAAVVMFVKVSNQWFHGGYIGEYLANEEGKLGIYEAELMAQTMAYKWMYDEVNLQVFNFARRPLLKIIYDSQSAGLATTGGFGGNPNNIFYVAARSMAQFVTLGCGWEVQEEHQKSHVGHPGNEAADDVAQWALTKRGKISIWKTFIDPREQRNLQWLWWVERFKRKGIDGLEESNAFAWEKPTAVFDNRVVVEMNEKTIPEVKTKQINAKLNIVHYNINTFNDPNKTGRGGKRFSPSKFEAFTRLCDKKNTHIFMLQETRVKRQIPDAKDYHIFQGLASRTGKGGVMIGISKRIGICSKAPVSEKNVKVMMANEETLVLRVTDPSLRAVLISGHAPHSGLPERAIQKWWNDLTTLLKEKAHGWPVIFGIDSNGRLGSMVSEHVGDHQQAPENFCGSQLHAFCTATDTILPATFALCQWGDGNTWQHPGGQCARLDYIGIPRQWSACSISTYIDQELAVNQSLYDHRPCWLTMKGSIETRIVERPTRSERRNTPNKLDYRSEQVKEKLTIGLNRMSEASWKKDVHQHLQDFYDGIKDVVKGALEGRCTTTRRKSYLTEDTWQLIQAKKWHRRHLFEARDARRIADLGMYFACWKGCISEVDYYERDVKEARLYEIQHHHMFQELGRQVARALRREDDEFFGEFAKNLARFDQPQSQRQLWREIRRYLPRAKERKHTTPVEQIDGLDNKWADYLCLLEAGEKKTYQQIYAQCIEDHNKTSIPGASLGDIPTLLETEILLRNTKMEKAMGMDQLSGDLLHQLPVQVAPHIWPIAVKMAVHATEPIQWKGGRMKWLHKKGTWDKAENFRGILLASTAGKRLQAFYRQPLMQQLDAVKDAGQLGGFRNMETIYGNHYIRSFMRIGHAAGLASVVIFVDLSAAFHSLIRELMHGVDTTFRGEEHQEAVIQKILDNVKLRGGRADILQDEIKKPGFLEEIAAPDHLINMLREMGRNNWAFTGSEFVTTHKGTRPGSPLADAMFHCIMTQINSTLTHAVANAPENAELCEKVGIVSRPILWADDVAFALLGAHNDTIIRTAEKVMKTVDATFTKKGMEVNYKKQKTEALFSFRGKEAGKQRALWLSGDADVCHVQDTTQGEVELNKTAKYKHLGVYHASGGTMDTELHYRIVQAWATWRDLRLPLFGPHRLTKATKVKLAFSLMFTKLLHGAEAWPVLSRKQLNKINRCYLSILRSTTHENYNKERPLEFLPDGKFLNKYNIPSLQIVLAKKRLLYAARMANHGEALLKDILNMEDRWRNDSWLRALRGDLEWLELVDGPRWGTDIDQLTSKWKMQAGWKAYVNTAVRRHIIQEKVASKIREAGSNETIPKIDLTGGHECHCGKLFTTLAQLGAHKHTVHGEHAETFWMAQGTSCYVCLREFWKHSRLKQHLEYAPRSGKPNRCRTFCCLYPDNAPFDLEAEDKTPPISGLSRHEAIRIQGPLQLGAQECDVQWARTWRTTCEADLAVKWQIPEPEVLRDSELQHQLDRMYSEDASGELGGFLESLNGCDVNSSKLVVNLLFWGWNKCWKNNAEKQSWTDIIHSCPEGHALFEWFEAYLCTAKCEAVSNAAPHREPNVTPANNSERLTRDVKINRDLSDCLVACVFPFLFAGRFWNKKQIDALGHYTFPTRDYHNFL